MLRILVASLAVVIYTVPASAQVQPLPRTLFQPQTQSHAGATADRALPIRWADAATLDPQETQPNPQNTPPPKEHTGFQALVRTTLGDFAAFPRRQSPWVILAIGAGGAALAHPADDAVNAHLVGNSTVSAIFAPGKYIGLGTVQLGAAVGTYLIGRYWVPEETHEGVRTNKVSHLGVDLVRANLVPQALTFGMKPEVRGQDPH